MAGLLTREEWLATLTLAVVLGVTAGWWALALWPVPGETPEWLEIARAVCFNAGADGMPDASGWILLIGQPLGMFGFLWVVWPTPLARGLRGLASQTGGRMVLGTTALFVLAGLAGTGFRVISAAEARAPAVLPPSMPVDAHPRLNRDAAPLELIDHRGERVGVDQLRGRPAVVTFGFAHCVDICPLVVQNALRARNEVWGPDGASLVVVTLDPWRDTPARLEDIARRWGLDGPNDHLLSGSVAEVEAVLDNWKIPRNRDPRTGDVLHPSMTYLLDEDGKVAFATVGTLETVVGLGSRLEGR